MSKPEQRREALVDQIAALASHSALTVGVAESLTGGHISTALAGGNEAAEWFRGSVVAYAPEVKFNVLSVDPGPVNTKQCSAQMAAGAIKLFDCDVAVSATGVGGPGTDEGVPPGTVFIACARRDRDVDLGEHHLDGSPPEVIAQAVELALESVLKALLESR
ncbi:MAG: CinA family protein [Marmoricola sp.]